MKLRVRQTEVAKAVGVSRATVAYALNPRLRERLRPETRQRVLDTVQRLGYRPHRHAQLMCGVKSGLIGVIHSSGVNQLGAQRTIHLSDATHRAGYQMLAGDAVWYPQGVSAAVTSMLDARVEGVVLCSPSLWFPVEELTRLRRAQIPVVAYDGMSLRGVPQVRPDIRQGMFDLARHLLGLGYRRLTLLTISARSIPVGARWPSVERCRGFQEALAADPGAQGEIVTVEHEKVMYVDPYRNGQVAMQPLLGRAVRPDAVLCTNDDWALGALTACVDACVRVPQDIAITGFDDTAVSGYGTTPLTTVAQPIESMANKVVEILVKLIRGEKLSNCEALVQLPCGLVVRRSCGAKQACAA